MSTQPKAPNEPPPSWRDCLTALAVMIGTAIVFGFLLRALFAAELAAYEAVRGWWLS